MKVLAAYDGSPHADAAIQDLQHAGLPDHSEILVVSIANDSWPPASPASPNEGQFDNPWNATMKETAEFAENAANRIRQFAPKWQVRSEPLWGNPVDILLKTIDHWKPDLLVVGSRGRGAAGRLLLGSVSLDLVHRAPCSVRVTHLPQGDPLNSKCIVAAIDGSNQAEAVIQAIAVRSWPPDTQVTVLSIFDSLVPAVGKYAPTLESSTFATEPAFQVIAEADERLRTQLYKTVDDSVKLLRNAGLNASGQVMEGNPLTQIADAATRLHAGTVFLGARGLGAIDRLMLGSVSSAVVTHSRCSVEVVRQEK